MLQRHTGVCKDLGQLRLAAGHDCHVTSQYTIGPLAVASVRGLPQPHVASKCLERMQRSMIRPLQLLRHQARHVDRMWPPINVFFQRLMSI